MLSSISVFMAENIQREYKKTAIIHYYREKIFVKQYLNMSIKMEKISINE